MEVAMKLKTLLGVALVLLAGTGVAHAGIFFGASVGDAAITDDDAGFDANDTGYKVFGGFTFVKFVGIEASYVDFGSPEEEVSPGLTLKADATGWDVFVKGILPIGDHFDIFAKAGVIVWDAEQSASGLINGSASDDGNDPAYGVGLTFRFAKVFGIRAEYEIFDIEDTDDVTMASAGIEFKF